MTAAPAPTGIAELSGQLADGAGYTWSATGGCTGLRIADAHGDLVAIAMTRDQLRRFLDAGATVGGLQQTPARLDLEARLAGTMRIFFERLGELDRASPAAVDRLLATVIATIRSWRPQALLTPEAP